jgi:hypothetical protein
MASETNTLNTETKQMQNMKSVGWSGKYLSILLGALVWSCGGELGTGSESELESEPGVATSELLGAATAVPAGLPVNLVGGFMVGNRLICSAVMMPGAGSTRTARTSRDCLLDPALLEGPVRWQFVTGNDLTNPDSRTQGTAQILTGPNRSTPGRLSLDATPTVKGADGVLAPINVAAFRQVPWLGAPGATRTFIVSYGTVAAFDDVLMGQRYATFTTPRLANPGSFPANWISELYRTTGLSRRIIEVTSARATDPQYPLQAKPGEAICPRDVGGAVLEYHVASATWYLVGIVSDLKGGLRANGCSSNASLL